MALHANASAARAPEGAALDPRDALRQATSHLHAAVDAGMPLSGAAPSLADYHAHLCLLRDWVHALRELPGVAPRLDAEAAALTVDIADCERLRASASPATRTTLQGSDSSSTTDADAEARAWGVAYVIEGSRLGGQVLYRRLAEPLAPHPLRYLQGAGAQTGAHWRAFLESLRAALDTPARVQAACEGAAWAFDRLLQLNRRAPTLQERAA